MKLYNATSTEDAITRQEFAFKQQIRRILRTHYKIVLKYFVNPDASVTRVVLGHSSDCGRFVNDLFVYEGTTKLREHENYARWIPYEVAFFPPRNIPFCYRVYLDLVRKRVQVDFIYR